MTALTWGDILRVVPVTGGIYPLAAQGSTVDQILDNGYNDEGDATTGNEDKGGNYYNDPVKALYCPDETTSGIEGNADLLIYATVNRHCPSSASTGGGGTTTSSSANGNRGRRKLNNNSGGLGTLASALSCQRDQYDRPITGSIDFCLQGMKSTSTLNNLQSLIQQKHSIMGINDKNENLVGSVGASEKWDGWYGVTNKDLDEGEGNNSMLGNNRETVQYSVGVAIHGAFSLTFLTMFVIPCSHITHRHIILYT